jgi:hypothetical protein
MKHSVAYNNQRNNKDFSGKFPGLAQCFSTCSWMLMSYWCDKIDATDDDLLSIYVDDVEMTVGGGGIAEIIKKKYNWITGRTSLWWAVQQAGIEKWLWRNGIKGNAKFIDGANYDVLDTALSVGPVIIGTKNIGGLPGGHIILIIGKEGGNYICHDPYGDALTSYKDENGESILYDELYLKKHAGLFPRILFWSEVV